MKKLSEEKITDFKYKDCVKKLRILKKSSKNDIRSLLIEEVKIED